MDDLARRGRLGLAETVPKGFHPGSDVANLSVFGYDPATCYSGRSPLEAASMGVELGPEDVAFRLNLVHLRPHAGKLYMADFSAGHISTAEARELIDTLKRNWATSEFHFYPGVSYRHLMVWRNGKDRTAVHAAARSDHTEDRRASAAGGGAEKLIQLMTSAQMLFHRHPVNRRREEAGDASGQLHLAVGARTGAEDDRPTRKCSAFPERLSRRST